jgi:hypothetical protein
VVIWSGEDGAADTLSPRFIAAGADMGRIRFVGDCHEGGQSYPFDPSLHLDLLRQQLAALPDLKMVIVDPVVSAVSGDSHKNTEVRRGLQPLVDLAAEFRCALVGITHFSKGTAGRDPLERITGSLAFGALARVVMVTAKQEDEGDKPARRVLLRAKSNIGPDGGGFVYELEQGPLSGWPGVTASHVRWGEVIEGSAREILAEAEADAAGDRSAAEEAREWLAAELANGPRLVKELEKEARAAGLSWRTIERERKRLGVVTDKSGFNGGWVCTLPKAAKKAEGRQETETRNLGGVGGLGESWTPADASESEEFEA